MTRHGDNSASPLPVSRFRGDPMACMDRLPRMVQRVLHEAVCNWCPLYIRWQLNRQLKSGMPPAVAESYILALLAALEADELDLAAHAWPARFGSYPHRAAGATIQRYGRRAS